MHSAAQAHSRVPELRFSRDSRGLAKRPLVLSTQAERLRPHHFEASDFEVADSTFFVPLKGMRRS